MGHRQCHCWGARGSPQGHVALWGGSAQVGQVENSPVLSPAVINPVIRPKSLTALQQHRAPPRGATGSHRDHCGQRGAGSATSLRVPAPRVCPIPRESRRPRPICVRAAPQGPRPGPIFELAQFHAAPLARRCHGDGSHPAAGAARPVSGATCDSRAQDLSEVVDAANVLGPLLPAGRGVSQRHGGPAAAGCALGGDRDGASARQRNAASVGPRAGDGEATGWGCRDVAPADGGDGWRGRGDAVLRGYRAAAAPPCPPHA